MLSRKNTEELLSSVVFLYSCLERIENRTRLVEGRLREIEADYDRLSRSSAIDGDAARRKRQPLDPAIEARPNAGPAQAAEAPADSVASIAIVVPVHGALADSECCLNALFENGGFAKLVVVDDASDKATAQFLDTLARRRDVVLVRNPKNLGYTRSINIGVDHASGVDAVAILNSDTVVTVGWIDRIRAAFNANPKVGIVGPWSNAATYQSLPAVKDRSGKFAVNKVPDGLVPDDLALALRSAQPSYPRVPVVNGFCFAVRRTVFETIGRFDEASFPIGYGEENDLCIRAADAGFDIAIADDAYVFHAKSKSFGVKRRSELARSGRVALNRKHGAARVKRVIRALDQSPSLGDARTAAQQRITRAAPASLFASFRDAIAYVLPAKPGGGGVHSIIQEASFLAAQGIKTTVFVPSTEMPRFESFYGDRVRTVLAAYRNVSHLMLELRPYSVIVATVYRSVPLVQTILRAQEKRVFYYIQDYEPFFHPDDSPEHAKALATYDIDPKCVLFAKTKWLQQIIKERHSRDVRLVLPSLDHETFFPAAHASRRNRVAAMVRPSTPRRGPAETVALAKALASRRRKKLTISLFGCDPGDPIFDPVRGLKAVECLGILRREEVADLLRRSDVFVDLSTYQAFGRTSIEGMACACVPIVPKRGGSAEFATPGWNAFDVDVSQAGFIDDCASKIDAIYADLDQFRGRCIETAAKYSVAGAATSIVKTFMQG